MDYIGAFIAIFKAGVKLTDTLTRAFFNKVTEIIPIDYYIDKINDKKYL